MRAPCSPLLTPLAAFLSAHGAPTVTIEKANEAPALHPRSGKLREVYSELTPERGGRAPRPTMTPTPDCDSTTTADHGFTADRAGPLGAQRRGPSARQIGGA